MELIHVKEILVNFLLFSIVTFFINVVLTGGPLACNGVLRGIVSFGNLCAKPNFPGVYMDTGYYYNWITKNSSTQTTFSLFMIFSGILALMMF